MIFAIDFDGTITDSHYPDIGHIRPGFKDFYSHLRERDDKIILWTCRNGESLKEAVAFCKENGIEFDAINENIKPMPHLSCKVVADYYIDDRAIGFYQPIDWHTLNDYLLGGN